MFVPPVPPSWFVTIRPAIEPDTPMRLFVVLLSVLSGSALVLPVHTPRTVASFSSAARAGPATMGFEDSLATMIDAVSAFIAKSGATKKPPVRGPAHSECRLRPRT